MSTGRLARAALVVNSAKGRLLRAELTSPTQGRGLLFRAALSAPLSTTVSAGPDIEVDGRGIVQIGATYIGATPVSWTWTQISGPAVALIRNGANVEFVAPALADGGTVVLSVSATNSQTTSTADFVTIKVFPHQNWELLADGVTWIPSRTMVTL